MVCLRAVLAVSVSALWLAVAPASAGTRATPGCQVDTPYAVQVDADGLRFDATDDVLPKRVDIHDGGLRLDGAAQAVSAADAARLREIEAGTRALLPQIAAVAREAIQIGFDALGGVHAALGGDRRRARQIEALRQRALLRVDQTLGRGSWDPETFGAAFEAELATAASEVAATVTPARAVWMAFTGGGDRLERRMEAMEANLERQVAAREQVLEAHADALCAQLDRLHLLQESLELRLDDGRALQLFEYEADADGTTTPVAPDVAMARAPR